MHNITNTFSLDNSILDKGFSDKKTTELNTVPLP